MPGPDHTYRKILDAAILLCLLSAPWWLYNLFFTDFETPYFGTNKPLVMFSILAMVAVNLGLLHVTIKREPAIGPIMTVGFFLKMAAVGAYLYMVMQVYEGTADLIGYFRHGTEMALRYELTGQMPTLTPFWSTNFITITTAYISTMLGPSMSAIMVLFASFGFWGQYLYYRTFCHAFPEGDRYRAILYIFLLPSIVYWTSAIGKDGLMLFGLGLTCYGLTAIVFRNPLKGVVPMIIGLAVCLLVRPHIAGLVGIALASTFLLGKNRRGVAGMVAKTIGIPLLIMASFYLVAQAKAFVDVQDISDTSQVLNSTAKGNRYGGSKFGNQSLPVRIAYAPFLLFRPFPWEIHNAPALMASGEGLFLLWMFWKRRRVVVSFILNCRANTFNFFLVICMLEFAAVLAGAITNFGLLARERVMMMPMAVMLLCLPENAAAPLAPRTSPVPSHRP